MLLSPFASAHLASVGTCCSCTSFCGVMGGTAGSESFCCASIAFRASCREQIGEEEEEGCFTETDTTKWGDESLKQMKGSETLLNHLQYL